MNSDNKLSQFLNNVHCVLEHSPHIMIVKDPRSTCYGVSKGLCDLLKMSNEDFMGHKDTDLPWAKFSDLVEKHDRDALSGKQVTTLEPLPVNKNAILTVKIVKSAIVNDLGEAIGLLGQGNILTSRDNLGALLSLVNSKDQKIQDSKYVPNFYQIDHYHKAFNLTQRETECLFLLIRGKSTKEIARFLELSHRTVEGYIEHIKDKMHISTRAQIITKAIEMGLLDIIPKGDMLGKLCKNINKWKDFLA